MGLEGGRRIARTAWRAWTAQVILLVVSGAIPPSTAQETPLIVRVGLAVNQPVVEVAAGGPVDVEDVTAGERRRLGGGRWVLTPLSGGVEISGIGAFGPVVRFVPLSGTRMSFGSRAYRGNFLVRSAPEGSRLTLINEVDLEEYLYGVLKMEISPAWPMEALKAQAVAARTLAVYLIQQGRYKEGGYDVRDTVESQVYAGVNAEDPVTTQAVEATRGLILAFQGGPINAVYHADSGGHTEDSEYVWGKYYPYLRGVPDPYSGSPYSQWSLRMSLQEIEELLRRQGLSFQGIQRIDAVQRSPSGRVMRVRIVATGGGGEISGEQLRRALGYDALKSTKFTIVPLPEGVRPAVEFRGSGWGHGVGLPQWSARNMALSGRTFEEILTYYYQGVSVLPLRGLSSQQR
jgi:stage II sporulation protein D